MKNYLKVFVVTLFMVLGLYWFVPSTEANSLSVSVKTNIVDVHYNRGYYHRHGHTYNRFGNPYYSKYYHRYHRYGVYPYKKYHYKYRPHYRSYRGHNCNRYHRHYYR